MPGTLSARSRRAKGSWIPRLVGVGVVGAVAAGGVVYLGVTSHSQQARHRSHGPRAHPTLSARVVSQQTVGLINFGPYNDGDPFVNDADDHPLMLQPTRKGLWFVPIPQALLATGQPQWTVDQMVDGSDIFIYNPTGTCLAAAPGNGRLELLRCAAARDQRWRSVHPGLYFGQAYSAYANAQTGQCLTAPVNSASTTQPGRKAPTLMRTCGRARTKSQQIAFWWSL